MKSIVEIALSVLTRLKKITGRDVEYELSLSGSNAGLSHELWNELVKKHVSSDGLVNYKGFSKDKAKLIEYTSLLSSKSPSESWSKNQQIAYWINAYNAFTVLLVVNHYPVKSIKEIGGNIPLINSVWDIKFFKIGIVEFDLNTIEHDILRKKFNEPRIHFAINCASISCPILRNEAFTATDLESQLMDQAKKFINNPNYNLLSSKKIKLSKIFEWFKSDFTKNQTIIEFIEKYSSVTFGNKVDLEYLQYNWDLNEIKNQ